MVAVLLLVVLVVVVAVVVVIIALMEIECEDYCCICAKLYLLEL